MPKPVIEKGKGGREWVRIDGEKFREAIDGAGANPGSLARVLGCGHDITNAIARGKISRPLLLLVCTFANIDEESFVIMEEQQQQMELKPAAPPEEIVIAPEISDGQWKRLSLIIENAVKKAITETRQ